MDTNIIYNENNVTGLYKVKDGSIDLTVTSPPYDSLRSYNGYSFDFDGLTREIYRVTKNGGVVVWIVSDGVVDGSETGTSFRQALGFIAAGFRLHDTMIWEKDSFSFPDKTRYRNVFEYMFVFSKGRPKTVNLIKDRQNKYAGMRVHGTGRRKDGTTFDRGETWKNIVCADVGVRFNVWHMPSEKANKTGHPAVFPVALAQDHILSWSDPGDVVLDPFMGSGTTAVAAIQTGRKYIGYEVSREYCEIAEKRLQPWLETWEDWM